MSLEPLLDLDQRLLVDLVDGLLHGELVRDGGPEHGERPVPDILREVRLHLLKLSVYPCVDSILICPVVACPPGGPTSLRKDLMLQDEVGFLKILPLPSSGIKLSL